MFLEPFKPSLIFTKFGCEARDGAQAASTGDKDWDGGAHMGMAWHGSEPPKPQQLGIRRIDYIILENDQIDGYVGTTFSINIVVFLPSKTIAKQQKKRSTKGASIIDLR